MRKDRPKLFSYVLNSPTRGLGLCCLLLGLAVFLLAIGVFDQAALPEDANEYDQLSFWFGGVIGLAAGPYFVIGFMSRIWGRVAFISGFGKACILGYVLMTNQAVVFLEPFLQNQWFAFVVSLDGLFLLAMLGSQRNRYAASSAQSVDRAARQAHADYLLRANTLNSWIAGSKLADRVQNTTARRSLSMMMVASALLLVLIFLISYHDPILNVSGVPQDAAASEKINALFGTGSGWIYQTLAFVPAVVFTFFQMGLRPLMALNNEPLDERQIQMIRFAHADGRMISLLMLALIVCLACFNTPATVIGPVACGAFLIAWLTPYLIMAWNLPDGDGSYEEDEDYLEIDYA